MEISSILMMVVGILMVGVGIAGILLPALPGLPFMFLGLILLSWADNFVHVGVFALSVMAIITILGMIIDFVAGILGAKAFGASRQALWGAFIGGILGLFLGLVGVILGPLIGAAVGEFIARKNVLQAGKVGIATFVGFIIGTVAKVGCAIALLTTFAFSYFV